MKRAIWMMAALTLLLGGVGQAKGAYTIYTTEYSFDAATSGLFTQTFAGVAANIGIGPGDVIAVDNPLNNSTNSAMLPGLSISASTNNGEDLAVIGPNYGSTGLTNYSVFSNYAESLTFTFAGGVTAASLDVLSLLVPSNILVSIYDTSGNSLGTYTVMNAPDTGSGEFIGFTSIGSSIGSVTIVSLLSDQFVFAGVDQVEFGSAGFADPTSATPAPSTFTLLGMGAVCSLGYGWRRRKLAAA